MDYSVLLTGLACGLAFIRFGGALYEITVVDPFWPKRPDLIQPDRGGISRKRFWIPAHSVFEVVLLITLAVTWSAPEVRLWLLISLASHVAMRIWSAFDFIPKALTFERADPKTISETDARIWTRRSMLRLPLDLVTAFAAMAALIEAAQPA